MPWHILAMHKNRNVNASQFWIRMLRISRAVCLVSVAFAHANTLALAHADPTEPAPQVKAQPFALQDVRLTGGPLKAAQDIGGKYLLSLSADRLLSRFRGEAGLKPRAPQYPDWEDKILPGVGASFYLSGLARMAAVTGDRRYYNRLVYMIDELETCQKANKDGFLLATVGARKFVEQIERGDIRYTGGWLLNDRPEPYYALEKLFSGLRDAYRVAGIRKALTIEVSLADWLARHMAHLSDAQLQHIMACEYGGMNWVLADLYADTAKASYLVMSRRWDDKEILDPLSRGIDCLPGHHANTQFPKISGLAARYTVAGAASDLVTASFFWDRVVYHHTYASGGNSDGEHFGPPDKLNDRLSPATTESCNVYNMLRLTQLLYSIEPRAEYAEYVERALLNHVLSAQHPDGRVCYYLRLGPGAEKHYETLQNNFSCCVCSSMDSYAKIADYIYAHDSDGIFVNLFAPSTVKWAQKSVALTQETDFPNNSSVKVIVQTLRPTNMALRIRCPKWAGNGFGVSVNGIDKGVVGVPGNYLALSRTWRNGDYVEFKLPMPLHTEPIPDNAARIAIFKGPVLLAGMLSPANKTNGLPYIVDNNMNNAIKHITATSARCKFAANDQQVTVPLVPFYSVHNGSYQVYWDVVTPAQLQARQAVVAAEAARNKQLDAQTTDMVRIGDEASEKTHGFAGEHSNTGYGAYGTHLETRWRDAQGWFSYRLKVGGGKPLSVRGTYWGGELGARTFNILLDGVKIGEQKLDNTRPGEFYNVLYPIPPALIKGKTIVTVRFEAHPGNTAGGLFGLRIVGEEA